MTELEFKEIPPVQFYPISSNPRDAHELLPILREFFSRYPEYRHPTHNYQQRAHEHRPRGALDPEYRHREAWELQWLLYALGFSNDLEDENEIASAAETTRRDFDPEEGAA